MDRRSFLAVSTAAAAMAALPAVAAPSWMPGVVMLPEWRGSGMRQVAVLMRGPWAIERVGDPGDHSWTLYHLPTKTRAAWAEDDGIMEGLSAVLDGVTDFSAVTEPSVGPAVRELAYAAAHQSGFVRWGECLWGRA